MFFTTYLHQKEHSCFVFCKLICANGTSSLPESMPIDWQAEKDFYCERAAGCVYKGSEVWLRLKLQMNNSHVDTALQQSTAWPQISSSGNPNPVQNVAWMSMVSEKILNVM